jgi:hypothetical protein
VTSLYNHLQVVLPEAVNGQAVGSPDDFASIMKRFRPGDTISATWVSPTMLALLRSLGNVETESSGPVVATRIEIAESSARSRQNLLDLLIAVARGEIVSLPVLLRRLIRVPDEFSHLIRLPVAALLRTIQRRPPAE